MADVVRTSHLAGARWFKTDLSSAPTLTAWVDQCLTQAAFDAGKLAQGH